jgi:hypothetical protein
MLPSTCKLTSMKRRPLFLLMAALLAPFAHAQVNDWLIVPGQRVGPITAATTRAQLDGLFGRENVHDGNFAGPDVPEAATIVLGEDPSAGLAVTWDRERPATIRICFGSPAGPCKWRTASGIRIGLPIRELEKLNGKSFQLTGYASLGAGVVTSWRHGQLEEDPSACGELEVRLTPSAKVEERPLSKQENDLLKQIEGAKPYSSNYVPLLELDPIVSALEFRFIGAACGAK